MDLSKIFGDKSLTQSEFEAAIKAENIKLADLSTGDYVAKGKLTEQTDKVKELNGTIANLEKQVEELKEADPEALQKKIDELQKNIDDRKKADEDAEKESRLSERFNAATGDKKFINDFTKNGVLGEFKKALDNEENKGKSDKEIYEDLVKDRDGIFQNPNNSVDIPPSNPDAKPPAGSASGFAKIIEQSKLRK